MANCGLGCWEKLHHGGDVQPWGRSPEGLGEPPSLEGVQVSARQQTWFSIGSHPGGRDRQRLPKVTSSQILMG